MHDEVPSFCEVLLADRTMESFDLQMLSANMFLQVLSTSELLVTVCALKEAVFMFGKRLVS